MRRGKDTWVGVVAVLAIVLAVGGGVAGGEQAAQPAWADDLFDRFEGAVDEYNARTDDATGVLGSWLLRDARVNLYVRGADGGRAVYAVRLDDRFRVTDLERGRLEDPTLRVRTSRRSARQVATADDIEAEVRQGIRSGRIRLERVVYLLGFQIAIGAEEVLFGLGAVAVVSLAVAKLGVDTVLSAVAAAAQRASEALWTLWDLVSGLATVLTILDLLDLLDRVQRQVGQAGDALRGAFAGVLGRLGLASTDNDSDDEQ